ncbi:hypothetical protein TSAR_000646 [Trichomalopsis sarcophagae]|uniref:Uncharacterized protein n=1 Tax=Trichomalopsis sarcophagae TaxID=543379 RepID=A0A232EEY1_9HYME|nr:hypothetical protein TSAR_000646 [Trichomalopsis sarcophagae]
MFIKAGKIVFARPGNKLPGTKNKGYFLVVNDWPVTFCWYRVIGDATHVFYILYAQTHVKNLV